jgi:hypothetical protein
MTRAFSCLIAPAFVVLLGACEWKAEPASTNQALSNERRVGSVGTAVPAQADNGCSDDDEAVLGYRIPCGKKFTAMVRGVCSDCNACPPYQEGKTCECHARGTFCFDAGAPCGYEGEKCECNDGQGAIYTCDCEGGGDQCGCWVPRKGC